MRKESLKTMLRFLFGLLVGVVGLFALSRFVELNYFLVSGWLIIFGVLGAIFGERFWKEIAYWF